jgi:peptidoglycan hydrolase CwlO-like protein
MFKKVAIVGAVGLLTAAVLTQTSVGTWAKCQLNKADKHFESKITPEEDVKRIKQEVKNLDKDIDKARGSVAEERVEAKLLKSRVEEKKVNLDNARAVVDGRGKMMKEATTSKLVKWDGREVGYDKAKELLQNQVNSYKTMEKDLKNTETMLAVRERTRDLSEQHLQALITQKSELEAAVVELEADIKLARLEQVQSKYQNDGTRMAEVKESLAKLRHRIEVQREKLAIAKQYSNSTVENKSVDEILAEMDTKDKTTEISNKK